MDGNKEKANSLLKLAHIEEPPIDVHKIAKLLGFTIIESDFPDNYSGEIYIEGNVKSIGVNKNHSFTRQRFTIAHEIGHYINGHEYFDEDGEMLSEGEFDFKNPKHQQEKEANQFGSELLMPEDMLKKELDKVKLDISFLTKKFQVSPQALWIRLISSHMADKYSPAGEIPDGTPQEE